MGVGKLVAAVAGSAPISSVVTELASGARGRRRTRFGASATTQATGTSPVVNTRRKVLLQVVAKTLGCAPLLRSAVIQDSARRMQADTVLTQLARTCKATLARSPVDQQLLAVAKAVAPRGAAALEISEALHCRAHPALKIQVAPAAFAGGAAVITLETAASTCVAACASLIEAVGGITGSATCAICGAGGATLDER